MTPQEIIKANRKILDFIGVEPKQTGDTFYLNDAPFFYSNSTDKETVLDSYSKYAKYHTSWDWLMPVVQKIETLGFTFTIAGVMSKVTKVLDLENSIVSLVLGDKSRKLELVYLTVSKFIDWYNSQNLDPDGNPSCKVYKGETVLPNEDGNCSLCEGDCTNQ